MHLPLPDSYFVGGFLVETLWATMLVGTPMAISLVSILMVHSWGAAHAILVSVGVALTVALGLVSGKEWVRRTVPSTWPLKWMLRISFLSISMGLLASYSMKPGDYLEFGNGTMHTVQWLPSGWSFGLLSYALGVNEEIPFGAILGLVAILSCIFVSRNGYQISEFRSSATGIFEAQRAEFRDTIELKRTESLAATIEANLNSQSLKQFVEFYLYDLESNAPKKKCKSDERRRVTGAAALLGVHYHWRRSTSEIVLLILMIGCFAHLMVLSSSQWLGSITSLYLTPWTVCSCLFLARNLKGNFTSYSLSSRSVAFAMCYLPLSFWDVFCHWLRRVWFAVAVKSMIILLLLLGLYAVGLPGPYVFFLWMLPMHICLCIHYTFFLAHPIHGNDVRGLLYFATVLPVSFYSGVSSMSIFLLRTDSTLAIAWLASGIAATFACAKLSDWLAFRHFYDWNYK